MILMNGATEIRQRNSEGFTVLKCLCAYSDTAGWHQMCDPHGAQFAALHEQARIDHLAKELT